MKKEIIITVILSILLFFMGFSLIGSFLGSTDSSASSSSSAFDMDAIKNGDYIVKTDEPNALPVLSEEQLKTACNCLKDKQKENALKYIDDVKKVENKYKVNAVFALAVFRKENQIASDYSGILGKGTHNIGSITTKSSDPKSVKVVTDKGDVLFFKVYDSFEEAIDDFGNYLANHKEYYFSHKEYTVDQIAEHYCNAAWAKVVKGYINDFYEAAGVDTSSGSSSGGTSTSSKGDGYDKVFTANGKTYKEFKQSRGSYESTPFGSGGCTCGRHSGPVVCHNGCGPTSAAVILSGYGKNVTPKDTATSMKSSGRNQSSGDTISWVIKKYGIKAHAVYNPSKEQIKQQLKSGKPLVVSVNSNKGCRYTKGGHLMAVLDIRQNSGKTEVYISNPNPKTHQGWDTLDNLHACCGSKYAIFVDE